MHVFGDQACWVQVQVQLCCSLAVTDVLVNSYDLRHVHESGWYIWHIRLGLTFWKHRLNKTRYRQNLLQLYYEDNGFETNIQSRVVTLCHTSSSIRFRNTWGNSLIPSLEADMSHIKVPFSCASHFWRPGKRFDTRTFHFGAIQSCDKLQSPRLAS